MRFPFVSEGVDDDMIKGVVSYQAGLNLPAYYTNAESRVTIDIKWGGIGDKGPSKWSTGCFFLGGYLKYTSGGIPVSFTSCTSLKEWSEEAPWSWPAESLVQQDYSDSLTFSLAEIVRLISPLGSPALPSVDAGSYLQILLVFVLGGPRNMAYRELMITAESLFRSDKDAEFINKNPQSIITKVMRNVHDETIYDMSDDPFIESVEFVLE